MARVVPSRRFRLVRRRALAEAATLGFAALAAVLPTARACGEVICEPGMQPQSPYYEEPPAEMPQPPPPPVQTGPPKVEVILVAEAGCPYCQRAILGPLNDLVNMPGVADIMDLVHHPFGNNYYATPSCGGEPYRKETRECWTSMCVMVPNPPPECFQDSIVAQHGAKEAQVNRMEACAKLHAATWQVYWQFMVCMEREYDQGIDAMQGCTSTTELDYSQLEQCYNSIEGDRAMITEATASIVHSEVPYITVNGRPIEKEGVLAEVCEQYTGPRPAGCDQGAVPVDTAAIDQAQAQAAAVAAPAWEAAPAWDAAGAQVPGAEAQESYWWPPQWT